MFPVFAKENTVTEMTECPRCGGAHKDLEISVMAQPMIVGEHTFNGWTWCPVMLDPIMLTRRTPSADSAIALGDK